MTWTTPSRWQEPPGTTLLMKTLVLGPPSCGGVAIDPQRHIPPQIKCLAPSNSFLSTPPQGMYPSTVNGHGSPRTQR